MTYLCGLVSAVMFKLALYTFESVLDLFGNSECLVKGFHLEPNRMMYFSFSFIYLLIIITIIVILFLLLLLLLLLLLSLLLLLL